jgi:hypothetical protein
VATLSGTYYAAWHDCGNPACTPAGMSCNDDSGVVAAWPNLHAGYQIFDYITKCRPDWPQLNCGYYVQVKNVDLRSTGVETSKWVKIVEAGPGNACPLSGGRVIGIDLARPAAQLIAPDYQTLGQILVQITV